VIMSIEALLFNSFGQFTQAEPDNCVATRVAISIRHWVVYSARGIGLQVSAGAAEHEARSRAAKILATMVDSPSKSVSCR